MGRLYSNSEHKKSHTFLTHFRLFNEGKTISTDIDMLKSKCKFVVCSGSSINKYKHDLWVCSVTICTHVYIHITSVGKLMRNTDIENFCHAHTECHWYIVSWELLRWAGGWELTASFYHGGGASDAFAVTTASQCLHHQLAMSWTQESITYAKMWKQVFYLTS